MLVCFGLAGLALMRALHLPLAVMLVWPCWSHISAASGSLAWMTMEWIRHGKPSVLGIVTGMVAGLGTITPASGFVGPGGALVIGLSAGIICYYATQAIKQKFLIDDSLDVFPVHGVGGILGTLLAGVFASDALGVFSGHGYNDGMTMASQVQVQIIGIVATFVYTAVVSYLLLKLVDKLLVLRVRQDDELQGVDLVEHDERGTIYKIDERTHTARYKKIKTIKHLKPLTLSAAFLYIALLDGAICYITQSRNDLVK